MPKFSNNLLTKIKNYPHKKYFFVGAIALIIIINIIGVINNALKPPNVVALPQLNATVSVSQELVFVFNKTPTDIKIVYHPAVKHELEVYENTLVVKPTQYYQEATQYQVEVKYRNQILAVFEFTTKEMVETEVIEKDNQDSLEIAPLIQYMPVDNESYYMTYTGPLELTITIKQGTKTQIEPQIKKWIESKGVDPENHKLIFKTAAEINTAATPTTQSIKTEEEKTKLFEITN